MKQKHESKPKKHDKETKARPEPRDSANPRYHNGLAEKVEEDMILRR